MMRELHVKIADLLMDQFHWAVLTHEQQELIRERVDKKLTELEREDLGDTNIYKMIDVYVRLQIKFFTALRKKDVLELFYDIPYNVRMKLMEHIRNVVEQDDTLSEKQKNEIIRASTKQMIAICETEKDEEELKRAVPQIIEGQINIQRINTIK